MMLKDQQDAYGHGLLDHLSGKPAAEIVQRDDGYFNANHGFGGYFTEYRDWPPHCKRAMKHVRGQVLDIGCGAGRHSLYLQEAGFDVLGIDNSPLAIKVCKQRGLKKARVLSITQVTSKLGRFDTILMLGNNFGLFGSFQRARWLLRRFKGVTSENARIIAESNDPYMTEDPEHLAYHRRNRRRGRMGGQIRMQVRYRSYATPWFDYLLVSKDEMKAILAGTGWAVRRFLDSEGSAYVAVIEKECA